MKANELNSILNRYIEHGHGDDNIVITLRQPSVGPRAGCTIESTMTGFDWERGQIRLQPEKDLTTYERGRDMPLDAVVREYDNLPKKRIVYKCPKCEEQLKQKQLYCGKCGQRVTIRKAGDKNEKT